MVIRLFGRLPFLVLFAELDQLVSLLHCKALVQEGIDEQVHVLPHRYGPPLLVLRKQLTTRFDGCDTIGHCYRRKTPQTLVMGTDMHRSLVGATFRSQAPTTPPYSCYLLYII